MASKIVWFIMAMVIGAVALYALQPSPTPTYTYVVVPAERIIEREPDTVRTFVDRIITVEVEPKQVAVAPGGARQQVQAFCQPTIEAAQPDTASGESPVDPMLLLRSVRYDRRWSVRKDRLFVAGPVSTGDLMGIDYEVRGDWTLATRSASALVQYPRTSLLYDLWEGGTQVYSTYKILEALWGVVN